MPFGGNDWLALTTEPTVEPEMPICDPHHHFWDFRTARLPYQRYLLHELAADMQSGHNVRSTVFIEARAMYRADGPEALARHEHLWVSPRESWRARKARRDSPVQPGALFRCATALRARPESRPPALAKARLRHRRHGQRLRRWRLVGAGRRGRPLLAPRRCGLSLARRLRQLLARRGPARPAGDRPG